MVKRKVAAIEKVDADLTGLQLKIKRDPKAYEDEFMTQWNLYAATRDIFLESPSLASQSDVRRFHDQVDLLAHIADCYPIIARSFPDDLRVILKEHHTVLDKDLREKLVGSLVLLRRRDVIDSAILLKTLLPILVSSPSKTLRALLFQKILSDLRDSNSKSHNHRLNSTVQTSLFTLVTSDPSSPKALWAVKLTRELWKRQIWTTEKPISVMKEACLADSEKVVVGAVHFFLGGDKEREELEDESSDDDAVDLRQVKHQVGIKKKSKKNKKAYTKALEKVKKQERKKSQPHPLNFSALHLVHDPDNFAKNMFEKHLKNGKSKLRLEGKLLVLQLVTRLAGLHKLTLIDLYSWFAKYLTPRQQSVTSFLASLAQATHNLVPPDDIEPLVRKIANEFVSEASAAEVASAGINAIREICVRQPLVMTETLLQDLVQYRKSKDKGVMMAAKGLLSLYREVGADLLQKRDRGKDATIALINGNFKSRVFGEQEAGTIEGLELLEKWKEEQKQHKRIERGLPSGEQPSGDDKAGNGQDKDDKDDDEGSWNSGDWEIDSDPDDDSNDSGGWINVSDSEDDVPAAKKPRIASEDKVPRLVDVDTTQPEAAQPPLLPTLATTTILTPADLAKLKELRMAADINRAMGQAQQQKEQLARHADDPLTAEQLELPAKLRRTTKEERVALAREGKPDRAEHKSTQAIRKSKMLAEGKSTTNKEKARRKNILMTMGKAKMKQKRSLIQTRRILQNHVERSKRGGRRGNKG